MKQRISFLLACVFLCLPGCRASGAEQTFFAMDTVMSVQVSGRRGPQAVAAAREAVERLDDLLSRTDSDSQIARLNTAAGDGAAVAVDPDVAELLAFSQEIARQLPGDFDITIAPVMDAWGFTTEERHVPAPDALAAAMALVDSAELSVDTEASAASLARAGMEVDLGAVAKGFAAREAEAAIRDAGGTSAMLDLGGNVTVIGAKEDGSPWRVAVKDPRDTGSYLCVLALTDVTLSTSGGISRRTGCATTISLTLRRAIRRIPACCLSPLSPPTTCWPTPSPPPCLWRGRRRRWTSGGAGTTSSWCFAPTRESSW